MSRRNKMKRQRSTPPPKPPAVQAYEAEIREQKLNHLFFNCRMQACRPFPFSGEVEGAMIANNVLNQILQQIAEQQAKIIIPKPGMLIARPSPSEALT